MDAVILILSFLAFAVTSYEVNFQNDETFYLQVDHGNDPVALLEEKYDYGPILEFPLGKILPITRLSRDGRNFSAFYKVPYAKPPLGSLRFELPEAVEAWEGIRNETQVAPQCIQKVKYSAINESAGEEDCLYMNIYTPRVPTDVNNETELMPTLVYIHGGGTSGNGSRYGPEYFMDENVVLITFQYRIGAFGYLSVPGTTITGNMGYKDQVMVFKWVQEYIKYFGGDPNRVMIYGNSFGAMSVGQHLLSPMSEGLFHRAILQSGGTILMNIVNSNPEETMMALARETSCPTSNIEILVDCLKYYNASELAIIQKPDIIYSTVLEVDDGTGNAFMLDYPMNLYKSGKLNNASVIIGLNSAERLVDSLMLLSNVEATENANENWAQVAPELLNYKTSAPDPDEIAYEMKELYFGNNPIGNETLWNFTDMATDRFMTHSVTVEGTFHSEVNDVYLYYLTRQPAKSYAKGVLESLGYPPGYYGPTHADELQFFFFYYDYPYISQDSEYYSFSKTIVRLWSEFAATGMPGQDWKAFRPQEGLLDWYMLDEQPIMVNVLEDRMKFWHRFSAEELGYE